MSLILSIHLDQAPGRSSKAYRLYILLREIDRIVLSPLEFYEVLGELKENIEELDRNQYRPTKIEVYWSRDKALHIIDISTRSLTATLTAKHISPLWNKEIIKWGRQ